MFENKGVYKCTWHQSSFGRSLTINFVILSCNLSPLESHSTFEHSSEERNWAVKGSALGSELDSVVG